MVQSHAMSFQTNVFHNISSGQFSTQVHAVQLIFMLLYIF